MNNLSLEMQLKKITIMITRLAALLELHFVIISSQQNEYLKQPLTNLVKE